MFREEENSSIVPLGCNEIHLEVYKMNSLNLRKSQWSFISLFFLFNFQLSSHDLIQMDCSVCKELVWLMQPAKHTAMQVGKEFLALPCFWMGRLSTSLAANFIRCLHGLQMLLDTYKHKDVCWVVGWVCVCAPHTLSSLQKLEISFV